MDDEDEFGEADFEKAIGLNRFALSIIGTWPGLLNDEQHYIEKLQGPFIILFILIAVIAPQTYALVLVINDLPLVVENITTLCSFTTSAFQLLFFYIHTSTILTIMKCEWLKKKDHCERGIMIKVANRGRIFTLGGFAMTSLTVVGVIVGPYAGGSFRALNNITDRGDRVLPLQSYYPYDYSKSPYFEMSYLSQLITSFWTGVIFTSVLNFFSTLVFHVCGQMEILALKLKNLQLQEMSKENAFRHPNRYILKNFKEIINNHLHLIGTLGTIEESFKIIILLEFFSLTVIICSLGFMVLNTFDSNNSIPISRVIVLTGCLLSILLHTFVYCLAGETVEYYSDELFQSLCDSNWHLFPSYLSMDIYFVLTRLERPLRLGLNGIFYLNLETFCQIVKTAVGYISMLIAVKNK